METLLKMITVFAWITVIVSPLLIVLKIYLQASYNDSIQKTIDKINGVESNYTYNLGKFILAFVISLVYLIVK